MNLFPDKTECVRLINKWEKDFVNDATSLSKIRNQLYQTHSASSIEGVQPDALRLVGKWGGYRYKHGGRNDNVFASLASDTSIVGSLFDVIDVTKTSSLDSILKRRNSIENIYNFLKDNMLRNGKARIVTVSKALLMLAGFAPALDSQVLEKLHQSNPDLLTCSGVWPFCLYFETLQFIAEEQKKWEAKNGPMGSLEPAIPIGQVMDRILWGR